MQRHITLAHAFADALRGELSPEQWATMLERNADQYRDRNCCASHDFCDANITMASAFAALYEREPKAAGPDLALWNAAWDYAKRNLLSLQETDCLSQEYEAWLASYNASSPTPFDGDAEEALITLCAAPDRDEAAIAWLTDFVSRWEIAQRREDAAWRP